jgi:hypothetical protein
MRIQFELPEEDREHLVYLEGRGLAWETIIEGNSKWLTIHNWPVPLGYNYERVSMSLLIPNGYPDAQIDMAFFLPALQRKDGKSIKATEHIQTIDGKGWQRWSRHRSGQNPWRPGEDNLSTHLSQVRHWLEHEFQKG